MKEEQLQIKYKVYQLSELSDEDKELIDESIYACYKAYSPYSHFSVGCAVRMDDGNIVLGANQENIAYPSGLCAERTALFSCGMQDGNPVALAICAEDEKREPATAYPCGACRQVMIEFENKIGKQHNIRVMILRKDSTVIILDSVKDLLPFAFDF